MTLQLIVNHARADMSKLYVTDLTDGDSGDSGAMNVVSGARHLLYTQQGTAGRKIVYVNKSGVMAADTIVIAGADRHNGHHVRVFGNKHYPQSCANLQSGNNEYLSSTNAVFEIGNDSFSVAGWVRFASIPALGGIVSKYASADRQFAFYVNSNGTLQFDVGDGSSSNVASIVSTNTVTAGVWYHVAAVFNQASRAYIFVNGVNWKDGAVSGAVGVSATALRFSNLAGSYMNGQALAWGFWKSRALSAAECLALYNSGHPKLYADLSAGEQVNLTAFWDMGEYSAGTGAVTRADSAGGGYNLTDTNTTPSANYVPKDLFRSTNFAETLTGELSQDFVYSFGTESGLDALGVELDDGAGGAYAKTCCKIYFGQAFTLNNPQQLRLAPIWDAYVYKKQSYLVRERAELICANFTKLQINSFRSLPKLKDEPVFIYDSLGTLFANKLYHCMIRQYDIEAMHNDLYAIRLDLVQLRHYVT